MAGTELGPERRQLYAVGLPAGGTIETPPAARRAVFCAYIAASARSSSAASVSDEPISRNAAPVLIESRYPRPSRAALDIGERAQALAQRLELGRHEIERERHELVAAQPCHHGGRCERRREDVGRGLERGVTRVVPELVV